MGSQAVVSRPLVPINRVLLQMHIIYYIWNYVMLQSFAAVHTHTLYVPQPPEVDLQKVGTS